MLVYKLYLIIRTWKIMHAKLERWRMEMPTNRGRVKGRFFYVVTPCKRQKSFRNSRIIACSPSQVFSNYDIVWELVFLFCFFFCFVFFIDSNKVLVWFLSTLEFATKRDLKNAIRKLDGTELNGKRIRLVDVSVSMTFLSDIKLGAFTQSHCYLELL